MRLDQLPIIASEHYQQYRVIKISDTINYREKYCIKCQATWVEAKLESGEMTKFPVYLLNQDFVEIPEDQIMKNNIPHKCNKFKNKSNP